MWQDDERVAEVVMRMKREEGGGGDEDAQRRGEVKIEID